jgi:hypothetical protein
MLRGSASIARNDDNCPSPRAVRLWRKLRQSSHKTITDCRAFSGPAETSDAGIHTPFREVLQLFKSQTPIAAECGSDVDFAVKGNQRNAVTWLQPVSKKLAGVLKPSSFEQEHNVQWRTLRIDLHNGPSSTVFDYLEVGSRQAVERLLGNRIDNQYFEIYLRTLKHFDDCQKRYDNGR